MSTAAKLIEAQPAPPELARPWTGSRVVGLAIMALWLCLGVGIILFLTLEWDPEKIDRYAPRYWSGLQVTLTLVT
ncbi:MAG: amino acid ABC transporter permease, partial [Pseudomonadota bacterium]